MNSNSLMKTKDFVLVWQRLTETYGSSFTAKNGNAIDENGQIKNQTWHEELSTLTYDQIRAGLKVCRNTPEEFAPNVTVFISRCKEKSFKPEYYESLPAPKCEHSAENKRKLNKEMEKLKNKPGRRCMKFKHETYPELKIAQGRAMSKGVSKHDFIWERLKSNGWERSDEIAFARNKIGLGGYHAGLVTDDEVHSGNQS